MFSIPTTAAPVYPRWRGEHKRLSQHIITVCGLSPLARGTRAPSRADRADTAVYPRWRGEHERAEQNIIPENGLSPLARGTLRRNAPGARNIRFIPAGAGNTLLILLRCYDQTVYPRWRGEHGRWADIQALCDGLSPLARGTLAIMYDELPKYRFIPAGAGNTAPWLIHRLAAPVYPRWRGEHTRSCPSSSN